MARMFRRTSSFQRLVFDDFEPQSEWIDDPMANILKIHLPDFSKDQVTTTPGTSPNTIKVRGIRPLELKNNYRRFDKEFTIPDNTKVDEMSSNFENENFIIRFPKNIPNNLQENVPLQTVPDAKVEKRLDDQHVMVSSPKDQYHEQEATPPQVITSTDDKRVEERDLKEVADQIRPEHESREDVGDNLAQLMASEGKKIDKDQPLAENVVPKMVEPKPMSFEDTAVLKEKETRKEKVDEEPSFFRDVPKSYEEPPRFLARDFESRGRSTISPPKDHRESEEEKRAKEKPHDHEPSLFEDAESKTIEEHLTKSEVKDIKEKPEKQSVRGSVESSIVEHHPPKSNDFTQDDMRFNEREHKKEVKEPPILESAASRTAELEMMKKKHDRVLEPFEGGTSNGSEDVVNMTMDDINGVMAAAKKTLQLQASKLNEETQITVNIALALFDIIAAVGAYISHQSNIQRRSRN